MARMRSILRILRLLCYLAGVEDWLIGSELWVHVLGGCAVLSLSSWHSFVSLISIDRVSQAYRTGLGYGKNRKDEGISLQEAGP
jgi:hypothetical protein